MPRRSKNKKKVEKTENDNVANNGISGKTGQKETFLQLSFGTICCDTLEFEEERQDPFWLKLKETMETKENFQNAQKTKSVVWTNQSLSKKKNEPKVTLPTHLSNYLSIQNGKEISTFIPKLISLSEGLKCWNEGKRKVSKSGLKFQPRGFANPKNKCFLNVVLQILLTCKPFFCLLSHLNQCVLPTNAILLKTFSMLYNDVTNSNPSLISQIITPDYFYPLLLKFNPNYDTNDHIYQEDAQEFLCFLLDGMHEELVEGTKQETTISFDYQKFEQEEKEEEEEWQEVEKGNKTNILLTEKESFTQSPITDIFGGDLRSIVRKHNMKASATLQPFFCIHLDVQHPKIKKLEDALELFTSPEHLEGYTDYKTKREVLASKHTLIEKLPNILVIHLKRFSFLKEVTQKFNQWIEFPSTLKLQPSLLSSSLKSERPIYHLIGVVSHLGTYTTNGHYTCDIKVDGTWIHCDDVSTYAILEENVLRQNAYLLFYERK